MSTNLKPVESFKEPIAVTQFSLGAPDWQLALQLGQSTGYIQIGRIDAIRLARRLIHWANRADNRGSRAAKSGPAKSAGKGRNCPRGGNPAP